MFTISLHNKNNMFFERVYGSTNMGATITKAIAIAKRKLDADALPYIALRDALGGLRAEVYLRDGVTVTKRTK